MKHLTLKGKGGRPDAAHPLISLETPFGLDVRRHVGVRR
jgi:hypothetical protein